MSYRVSKKIMREKNKKIKQSFGNQRIENKAFNLNKGPKHCLNGYVIWISSFSYIFQWPNV